ncbi:uncharacterized protein A4U43_C07F8780 [Asparagus officinalis]|uniref:chalcone synthase n=1 Tax=Asparagus officinalis TaxID=4686 RepID=A0A5P1EDR7_ASPOF|nr:uncharacterized protein A4U43_C07F8780 [Asparagus officinalis]
MENVENIRQAQRADGMATIMAIGTARPPNIIMQDDFADFYFRVTNNEHKVELKKKFANICKKSMINKRYFYHNEEFLKKYPNICSFSEPSLNDRQDICVPEGCYAGGTVLRYAKDLAENNRGARVLIVCSELTIIGFRGPNENAIDSGIGNSLFGDGAAALIVGSDPVIGIEKPIFEIVSVKQRIIPDSEEVIHLHLREEGLTFHLTKDSPDMIANNIEQCLADAFAPVGLPSDWNSLFWIPHPGGRAILDRVEEKLNLRPEKFGATRRVLWDYGNMISACVLYILDEMRKSSLAEGLATTGEGFEWGVLLGFGPGMTVETIVLHSVPIIIDKEADSVQK